MKASLALSILAHLGAAALLGVGLPSASTRLLIPAAAAGASIELTELEKPGPPAKPRPAAKEVAAALPGTGGEGQADELRAYLSSLMRRLEEGKIYPRGAILREEEGRVVVSLEVAPDGSIREPRISEPCGFDSLNQAALESIQALGKLPPLPAGQLETVRVRVPLIYRLRSAS